jgi:dipeptidyl-peptidase 4
MFRFNRPAQALLIAAIAGASLVSPVFAQEKKLLTFDQIFKNREPRLTTPLPAVTGWADDGHYIESPPREGGGARPGRSFLIDAQTGKREAYRDMEPYRSIVGEGIEPGSPAASDDAFRRVLYVKDGEFYILDTESKDFRRLTRSAADRKNPTFSPDGKYVAFTRNNNLCAIEIASGKEYQYTTDGSDVVYNGWASWVYYEEILRRQSRYRAFWWSPDGSRLAFFRFDDSHVPVFPLFNTTGQHGVPENTRYPKAGDPNPEVRIGVVPVTGGDIVWSDFNPKADQYFGTPFWTPGGKSLCVQWMNRRQDTLMFYAVDPLSGRKNLLYEESQKSWVDWLEPARFLKDGFILRSDRDGWMHLYAYTSDGRLRSRLTGGKWSVVDLQAVDEERGYVYFTAKKEASTRTDLYRVNMDGTGFRRLTFGPFTHSVKVSPAGKYFVTTYSSITVPPRMALYTGDGTRVRDLADARASSFDDYALAKTELFTIPTQDGYNLPAVWVLPDRFDSTKLYPVLFSEYGGPGSESVSDGWRGIGAEWLAQEGLIQISVDHRGSGHFGKEGEALMYRNLGKWEMHDYCEAVQWLRRKPFIDSTRICITGGSYGGYVTCLALTEGADWFTHGVGLFSVTDWLLYDTHYVERYMGTPAENPAGYRDGSVLTYADRYRGLLRIVHGTMDDNVHMQNSLQLADRLEDLNRHFEFMAYPGERHGWGGKKAIHLRNESYRFYYTHLLRKEFPEKLFESAGLAGGRPRQ